MKQFISVTLIAALVMSMGVPALAVDPYTYDYENVSAYDVSDKYVLAEAEDAIFIATAANDAEAKDTASTGETEAVVLNKANYSRCSVSLNTTDHVKYLKGYGDGRFGPDNYLTRAEAAQIIYNLLSKKNVVITASYTDVPEGRYYYTAVRALATLGVMDDSCGKEFRPDEYVTRAEFLAMLSHFASLDKGKIPFTDVSSDYWAAEYIASAYAKGWIKGLKDNTFEPDGSLTRAEAATLANRILSRTADKATINDQKGFRCYTDVSASYWAYYNILEASVEHNYTYEEGHEVWVTYKLPQWQQGFYLIDGEQYYADATGTFVTNTTVGTFTFNREGKSTTGNSELDSYLTSIILKTTDNSMTQYQKLQAVYYYVRDNYTYLVRSHHDRGATGWEEESALFFMENDMGNCYCFAATFMYLARRLGYDSYCVSGGFGTKNSDHGWAMIPFDDGKKYMFDAGMEYSFLYGNYSSVAYNLFKFTSETSPFIYYFP